MQLRSSSSKIAILSIIGFLFIAQPSWAGRVVKVKGKKVYIMLDAEELDSTSKGDNLYLTTSAGKKRGIVTVRKKKGRKVIAQLRKGKAKKRMLTRARKSRKKRRDQETMEPAMEVAQADNDDNEPSDIMYGVLGAFGTATQNVKGVADMSGSSMGFKGIFDYNIIGGFGVKAQLGLDMISVSGSSASQDFATDITYLTVDMMIRYNWMFSNSFGLYGNLGMGIYSPMSTDLGTNAALEEDSISTTSVFILGAGAIVPFGSWAITGGVDYLMFPPSDEVDTNIIAAKVGVLFSL